MSRVASLLTASLAVSACISTIAAEGQERLDHRYSADQVLRSETTANFYGNESRGAGQVRGNGVLALTASELWFSQFSPDFELTIPLTDVASVELVPSHLGKGVAGRRLVLVRYVSGGALDAAAWLVGDPEAWRAAIDQARRK